jgi:hypothetical protein
VRVVRDAGVGPGGEQCPDALEVAAPRRVVQRRAPTDLGVDVVRRADRSHTSTPETVDTVPRQQLQPVREPVLGGPVELPVEELRRRLHGIPETDAARDPAVGAAEPVAKEQLEVLDPGREHPVVEAPARRWPRTAVEKQGRESDVVRMSRLPAWPLLALAEGAGEAVNGVARRGARGSRRPGRPRRRADTRATSRHLADNRGPSARGE